MTLGEQVCVLALIRAERKAPAVLLEMYERGYTLAKPTAHILRENGQSDFTRVIFSGRCRPSLCRYTLIPDRCKSLPADFKWDFYRISVSRYLLTIPRSVKQAFEVFNKFLILISGLILPAVCQVVPDVNLFLSNNTTLFPSSFDKW